MSEISNLVQQYSSPKERIDLEIQLYKKKYPSENFTVPEIILSSNFHDDCINIYKEFGYPNDYIAGLEQRANWDTTIALTIINNEKIKLPSKIVINEIRWRDDTILHELTHASDNQDYCERHGCSELSYLEFLDLKDFSCIYLFSEFRAFYRCAMYSEEDIGQRIRHETSTFQRHQRECIEKQQLEAYYYHSVSYVGFYCAYMDKCATKEQIESTLRMEDANIIHPLIKFLYPLRNKSFAELEGYFSAFQNVLDKLVSK